MPDFESSVLYHNFTQNMFNVTMRELQLDFIKKKIVELTVKL